MKQSLFVALQYLVPQLLLSKAAGWLASTTQPKIKSLFIEKFAAQYQVNMDEAEEPNLSHYSCFNNFFTRALKSGARPLPTEANAIISSADGAISQLGPIHEGRIFQAKGFHFDVDELLACDRDTAAQYDGGQFTTVYLSPKDYHRVHMPATGKLTRMTYIPGKLFSVNDTTVQRVPRLFARNERTVCHFETDRGPMAVVLVGAMIVASMETVWHGLVRGDGGRKTGDQIKHWDYSDQDIRLQLGDELGRFLLGSTTVVLFGPDQMTWNSEQQAGKSVRMGETMGRYK